MNTAKIGRIIENELVGIRATVDAISSQDNETCAVARLRCGERRPGWVTIYLIVCDNKIKKFSQDGRKLKVFNAKNVWPIIFKEFI